LPPSSGKQLDGHTAPAQQRHALNTAFVAPQPWKHAKVSQPDAAAQPTSEAQTASAAHAASSAVHAVATAHHQQSLQSPRSSQATGAPPVLPVVEAAPPAAPIPP